MAFNLNSFAGALNAAKLGARPNLFKVEVADPEKLGTDANTFSYFCQSGQIPGSTIGIIEVPYFGRTLKIPGNRTFEEWTTTITNSEGWEIRTAIEDWLADINGHVHNSTKFSSLSQLSTDLEVIHYGNKGEGDATVGGAGGNPEIARYKLVGAWPSAVSAIDLAWDSNDTLETFDITWQYQYWVRVDGTTNNTGALKASGDADSL
jgi:hypothetical protein